MRRKVVEYIAELSRTGKRLSWEMLKMKFKAENSASWIEFVEAELYGRHDIQASTARTQAKLITVLRDFNCIQTFADLTPELIDEFDTYLHKRGISQTTIHSYHKDMKTYINRAISKGLISESPYKGKKIERGKSQSRKYLTSEQLKKLESCSYIPGVLQKVRDMFLFQCYTGLAYADLAQFDFSKVRESGGVYTLSGRRIKTGEDYYIVLLPEAMEILKRYDFTLPTMTSQQYNLRLKVVADAAGIDVPLTSHMGRHTAACQFLNYGMPIEVVAKILGHADIKTTQIYAKIVNKTVETAFKDFAVKKRKGESF